MKNTNHHRSSHAGADAIDVLRDDVSTIMRDVSRLVSDRFGAAQEKARDLAESATEQAKELHTKLGKACAQRPLTTLAVGAVAGYVGMRVLGWAWSRRGG